jgi:HD-GYP domain-containing protein (c-di-GMP phosphodiesterase class II)
MGHIGSISYDELSKHVSAKELSTLLKVSSVLASTLELTEVLQVAIESATDLVGLDTGAIYLLVKETLYLGATTPPLPSRFPDELRFAHINDHPHIKKAITTKVPVYLDDARTTSLSPAEQVVVDSRHLVSILYFPLLLKDKATGAFIIGTTDKTRQFSEKEIDLCNILSFQVALAVANAQLYQNTQQAMVDLTRAYDATLEGWSRVLEMRDHDTDEHTHRVTDLTVVLARRMGVPESELGHIRRGALLHDIGKMGIPDSILQKPDVLSADEWAIMQTHPELAYQFLSRIDYLVPALDIPYCHHERWDGEGYPRKLRGEEIPLAARIFAVVDVFDALTSDRPYRKAWKKEDALAHLREQSGKYFFPEAVKSFLELLGE